GFGVVRCSTGAGVMTNETAEALLAEHVFYDGKAAEASRGLSGPQLVNSARSKSLGDCRLLSLARIARMGRLHFSTNDQFWVITMPSEQRLPEPEIAALNLRLAEGLPGLAGTDAQDCLRRLDAWASMVAAETSRLEHLYRRNPAR